MSNQFIHYNGDTTNVNVNINNGDDASDQQTIVLQPAQVKNLIINEDADNDFAIIHSTSDVTDTELFRFIVDEEKLDKLIWNKEVDALFFDLSVRAKMSNNGEIGHLVWQMGSSDFPNSWVNFTDVIDINSDDYIYYNRASTADFTESETMPFTIRLIGYVDNQGEQLTAEISRMCSIKVTYTMYKI